MSKKVKSEEQGSELEQCAGILHFLQSKPEATAFLEPVDWKALNLPDYPQIIKNPMDLGTIEKKLDRGEFADAYEFAEDVRQVWRNAKTYNQPGSGIYIVAEQLSKIFERKFRGIKKTSQKKKTAIKKESSQEERVRFTELVKQLSSDQLGVVVEMIEKDCPNALNEDDEDDLEIEVYHIDASTLQKLNSYAQSVLDGSTDDSKKRKRES